MIVFRKNGTLVAYKDEDAGRADADARGVDPHEVSDGLYVCACEELGGVSPIAHNTREEAELHRINIEGEGYDAKIERLTIVG